MEKFNFKKKFGQNFLKDVKVVEKIASVADITKEDLVIEVGPGKVLSGLWGQTEFGATLPAVAVNTAEVLASL